jgi:hypothetical protein
MTTIRKQANQAKRDIDAVINEAFVPTRADMVRGLKAMGYRQLGRGAFAVALAHPERPDVVVKVGQCDPGLKHQGRGIRDRFPEYVDFLKGTGTRSKFALKVYHHQHINGMNGGTYASVVERCKPGRGVKAQTAITASAGVVKGLYWYRDSASAPATRFIERFAFLGTLDLHSGNVMLRANGQAVITDPLC